MRKLWLVGIVAGLAGACKHNVQPPPPPPPPNVYHCPTLPCNVTVAWDQPDWTTAGIYDWTITMGGQTCQKDIQNCWKPCDESDLNCQTYDSTCTPHLQAICVVSAYGPITVSVVAHGARGDSAPTHILMTVQP